MKCLKAIIILVAIAAESRAFHATINTYPASDRFSRFDIAVYPVALGYAQDDELIRWHGFSSGISTESEQVTFRMGYGAGFTGVNSGGVFAGPLFDPRNRAVGVNVDILYVFFALPVQISFSRLSSRRGNNLVELSIAVGVGSVFPLFYRHENALKFIL